MNNELDEIEIIISDLLHNIITPFKAIKRILVLRSKWENMAREEQIIQDEIAICADDNFIDVDKSHITAWRKDRINQLTNGDK